MGSNPGPGPDAPVRQPSASATSSSGRARSWHRRALRAVVVLLALGLVLFSAATWYFSGLIGADALHVNPVHDRPNVVVTGVGSGWVELRPTRSMGENLRSSNVYGLQWAAGFGQVRGLRSSSGDRVRRTFRLLSGSGPAVGTAARVSRDAYPLHPGLLLGFPLRQVTYRSPAGTFPAYLASGPSDTWAILVHGRGTTRAEMFRLMRVTVGLGLPSLDITYRRDAETGGGMATFGQDEWPDLEAAVRWAVRHGAHRLVLVGASMGGAITAAFLEHSPLAGRVAAVVLDAPMLDFQATVEHNAEGRSLPVLGTPIPGVLTRAALGLAGLRYGLDLGQLDYLDDTSWVRAPVLAFQGTADPTNPSSTVERLAAARPGLVTAVQVPAAGHVESWNVDPAAYERQVRIFLRPLLRTSR